MLKGRLGLETARVPQADRHGLIWLKHGKLYVVDGTLRFMTAGSPDLPAGDYALPFQMLSGILLQPGTTVSHDALRLLARHGTALIAVGEDGIRFYAEMPFGSNDSSVARKQAYFWSDASGKRIEVARRMYSMRLNEVLPHSEISVLRGIEGSRMKEMYQRLAQKFGIEWNGRKYSRDDPNSADEANQAINHSATAVEAGAMIAVALTSTIPQLGFIHEDSSNAFCLDIADLHRDTITLPAAFGGVQEARKTGENLERVVRRQVGKMFRTKKIIPTMIDQIKDIFSDNEESIKIPSDTSKEETNIPA
ncbi:MAG: type I-E CRISPR-associated endonuclease Cas1 [Candidatus Riflebacteria bacterium]|nr:type I-E CRISPR-associated endonuclease Cas1 [Candidatus Riflebacteria bacterium]